MPSFGVMLRSRAGYLDGILVIVDERQIAEEIAFELRAKGHEVDVEELLGDVPRMSYSGDRAATSSRGVRQSSDGSVLAMSGRVAGGEVLDGVDQDGTA